MNRDKSPNMESVKIGGLVYEISKVPDLQGKSGEWGHIEYKTGKIVLDDSASQQIEDQTLIHEITHGILVEAGYIDHKEEQADRIGKILYQVLKDNNFSWLNNHIKDVDLVLDKQRIVDSITSKDGKVLHDEIDELKRK